MTETALIDVHAHFLTPRYVEEARAAGHGRPDGMPGWPDWDEETHLGLMDRWGVGTSLLSVSSPGIHFGDDAAARALARHVNETGAEIRGRHPERFGHFASIPLPDVDGALAEAAYALDELGSDGLAVETGADGVYLGHASFKPLYAELDRRRAVVFVHPTSPPHAEKISLGRPRPMLEFIFDSTRAASDLLFNGVFERFPGIEWIFPHGGGTLPLLGERMELFRSAFGLGGESGEGRGGVGEGAGGDGDEGGGVEGGGGTTVQKQLERLWYDMAGTPFPYQVPALTAAFGRERVLYGSDFCWTPAAAVDAQLTGIDGAAQPSADLTWRALSTANAQRLFPRLG
jgi:predicted TIM-barrel fold metal-dependent hydrolase